MLNRRTYLITEMYSSTFLHPLLYEAALIPACITLNTRQRLYDYQLISLPDKYLTKKILLISLKIEDSTLPPKELLKNYSIWR